MDAITAGRTWLTKDLADWVARVRRAAPTVPAELAYGLAWGYQSNGTKNASARCLDLVLGIKPWEHDDRAGLWAVIDERCAKLGGDNARILLALARWRAFTEENKTAVLAAELTAEPPDDGR